MLGKGGGGLHRQELQHLLQGRDKRQPELAPSLQKTILSIKRFASGKTLARRLPIRCCTAYVFRGRKGGTAFA